jgi:hypothetical protein
LAREGRVVRVAAQIRLATALMARQLLRRVNLAEVRAVAVVSAEADAGAVVAVEAAASAAEAEEEGRRRIGISSSETG